MHITGGKYPSNYREITSSQVDTSSNTQPMLSAKRITVLRDTQQIVLLLQGSRPSEKEHLYMGHEHASGERYSLHLRVPQHH